MSTLQPVNVAIPAPAAFGFAVQVSVAPAGVVRANVTLLASDVTVLPLASCTVTTGWVPNAVPPVEPPGCVVKANLLAGPGT